MVARTVAVRLTAEAQGYLATIGKAQLATQQFASRSQAAIAKHDQAINKVSNTAGLLGAGMLAGVGFIVKSAAQFDKAMSAVSATGQDARTNIEGLRKAAIDMGASTAFSATEAAKGIENLLKAGVSARDVMGGGLKGALDLAAAGNMEVGEAAEIAATAMTQFNLKGSQVPHIADLLAAGAGKAQGEVHDMGMALKQSGLVASQFGLSLEDTTGTLSAFAGAGLLGSDAGTSFKTMLLSLASPSSKAAKLMDELGIAAYDSEGAFVGITNLAGQLQEKLGGLSQAERDAALATIFGTDAIRSANVLYKEGATGIQGWIDKTNDAGYAAKVARERLNNLSGDLEALQGALESAFIQGGSGANEALRGLTQSATGAVRTFGNLPAPLLETGVKLTALAGIGLLAVGGIGKLATTAVELKGHFDGLSRSSPKTAKGIQAVGKAAGVAAAAMIGLQAFSSVSGWGKFTADVDGAAGALSNLQATGSKFDLNRMFIQWKGVTDDVSGFNEALQRAADPRWYDRIGGLLDGLVGTSAGAITQINAKFASLDKAISSFGPQEAGAAFAAMRTQAEAAGVPIEDLVKLFPQYSAQVRDNANATGRTVKSTAELADLMSGKMPQGAIQSSQALAKTAKSTGGVGDEAQAAKKQLKQMTEAMFSAANAAIELEGSEDGVKAAIDDATKAVKDNGKTLDNNTEKGRANRASLRNLATASIAYREKLIEQGAKQKTVTKTTMEAREAFIKTAIKMGATRKEAKELADKFGLVDKKINDLNNKTVKTKVTFSVSGSGFKLHIPNSLSVVKEMAGGGPVRGPGTGTSDSILGLGAGGIPTARVSNGEYVINAASTRKYRPLIDDINADRLAGGGIVHPQIYSNRFPNPGYTGAQLRDRGAKAISSIVGAAIGKSDVGLTGPEGSVAAYSAGMAGTIARLRAMGARSFTTYPGHHPSMAKARDVTPHNWKIANTARASKSVWYVIYQMRIASKNHGNSWRQFSTSSRRGDWQHRRHIHVAWYDKGGELKPGLTLAYNGTGRNERVTPAGGERPVSDYRFASSGMGGGMGTVIIQNNHYHFDRYIGSRDELRREINTANRQNRMTAILR